jgi:hypothetical protein
MLTLLFNAVILIGTACNYAALKLKMDRLMVPLMIYMTVTATVAYKQFLILFSPVTALSTGFSLFITAFCAYEIGAFIQKEMFVFKERLTAKMKESAVFSAMALAVFFIREFFGAGVISFPAPQRFFPKGLAEIELPVPAVLHSAVFLASIPGTVIVVAIMMTVFSAVQKKRGKTGV